MTSTPTELLAQWQSLSECLEVSIQQRNYSVFKVTFRSACRCFKEIQNHIEQEGKEHWSVCEGDVKAAVTNWQRIADMIPPWMEEIKEKAKQVEAKKNRDKKLGNAYSYMNKTGNNLKVKTR